MPKTAKEINTYCRLVFLQIRRLENFGENHNFCEKICVCIYIHIVKIIWPYNFKTVLCLQKEKIVLLLRRYVRVSILKNFQRSSKIGRILEISKSYFMLFFILYLSLWKTWRIVILDLTQNWIRTTKNKLSNTHHFFKKKKTFFRKQDQTDHNFPDTEFNDSAEKIVYLKRVRVCVW